MDRKKVNPVTSTILDDCSNLDPARRVIKNWGLPDHHSSSVISILHNLDFLDDVINEKIKLQNISGLPQKERLNFEDELRTACKIAMIVGGLLPPPKKDLKNAYDKAIKILEPLLSKLEEAMCSIDPNIKAYIPPKLRVSLYHVGDISCANTSNHLA